MITVQTKFVASASKLRVYALDAYDEAIKGEPKDATKTLHRLVQMTGKQVQRLREEEFTLNKSQFAALCGVDRNTVMNWERDPNKLLPVQASAWIRWLLDNTAVD